MNEDLFKNIKMEDEKMENSDIGPIHSFLDKIIGEIENPKWLLNKLQKY